MNEIDHFKNILRIGELSRKIDESKSNGNSLDVFSSELLEKKKLCRIYKYSIPFLDNQHFHTINPKSSNIESSNLKIFDSLYEHNDAKPSSITHHLKGVLIMFSKKVLKTETYRLYIMSDTNGHLINILPYFPSELKIKLKEYAQRYPRRTIDFLIDMWYPNMSKSEIFDLIRKGRKTNILRFHVFSAYDKENTHEIIPATTFTSSELHKPEATHKMNEVIHLYATEPFFKIFFKTTVQKPIFNEKKLLYQIKHENELYDLPLDYLLHNSDCIVFNKDKSLHWLNIFSTIPKSAALESIQKKYITNHDRIIVSRNKVGNIKYLLPLLQGDEVSNLDLLLVYNLESLKEINIAEETLDYIRNTNVKTLLEQMFGPETEKLLSNITYEWDGEIKVTSRYRIGNNRLDFIMYILHLKLVSKQLPEECVEEKQLQAASSYVVNLTRESFDIEIIQDHTNTLRLIN